MQNKIYDTIVVGAGPAGMSAALYVKRANLDVLVIEKTMPGGKVALTAKVENYLGVESIDGPDLAYKMFSQLNELEIPMIFDEVIDIKKENEYKSVVTKNNEKFLTKTVILATGTVNRRLNIENELKYENKGISYCAICDGPLYKDKEISVIGSGNSAVEEAIFLSTIAKKVHLIANKPEFKAEKKLVDIMTKTPNIIPYFNKQTTQFFGDEYLKGIKFKDLITNEETTINVEANFTFIGLLPSIIKMDEIKVYESKDGFIEVDRNMNTIEPGIFAAGDITSKTIRQIATAVNDGVIAAIYAKEYIARKW